MEKISLGPLVHCTNSKVVRQKCYTHKNHILLGRYRYQILKDNFGAIGRRSWQELENTR